MEEFVDMEMGTLSITSNDLCIDVEWTIKYFRTYNPFCINYSPSFDFMGRSWYLAFKPSEIDERIHELDLLLFLREDEACDSDPIRLEFSASLKTSRGNKWIENCATKIFDRQDCWQHGFKRFVSFGELMSKQLLLLPYETLTVICTMKNPTSKGNIKGVHKLSNEKENSANQSEIIGNNESIASFSGVTAAIKAKKLEAEQKLSNNAEKNADQSEVTGSNKSEASALTEISSAKHTISAATDKLLHDLEKMMISGYCSDLIVRVRGKEFHLHKNILGARSKFFNSKLKKESAKMSSAILVIDYCNPNEFHTLIHYIYTGTVDNANPENVCGLYETAATYKEHQLKAECLQIMMNTISIDNFCDYTSLALKHEEKGLLQKATELFINNMKKIIHHVKWKGLIEKYPMEAHNFYMKAVGPDD